MNNWKKSLRAKTPEKGYDLAVQLAQESIKRIQPDEKIREKLRPKYSKNANSLIMASSVVAIHFQTVAAANNYWSSQKQTGHSPLRLKM
ncbi:MAG TPA: hexameric tyrosine-coordinated heme protein [Bacillota bacterium]|nr:hexameric tyrosine-coordinated heme protein [Bacillota bacterium]